MSRADQGYTRDGVLVALAVSVGAVDAISWLGLGKVFTAFMTGNLAFIGFDVAGADGPPLGRALLAVAAFAVGAAIAARIIGSPRGDRLWPPAVRRALTVVAGLQGLFLVWWLGVGGAPAGTGSDGLTVVSAIAMGIQTAAIFTLGVRASFTTAATATLAVLAGDLSGWRSSTEERLRLLAAGLAVVVGAAIGGVLMLHATRWAPVLPFVLTTVAIVVARERLEQADESTARATRGAVAGMSG